MAELFEGHRAIWSQLLAEELRLWCRDGRCNGEEQNLKSCLVLLNATSVIRALISTDSRENPASRRRLLTGVHPHCLEIVMCTLTCHFGHRNTPNPSQILKNINALTFNVFVSPVNASSRRPDHTTSRAESQRVVPQIWSRGRSCS